METPAIDVTARTDARKDKIRKKQYPKVGDKIEYKVGENEEVEWFEVEVFGKGKVGGRNEGYLNIRYADGSGGGIDIVKHQWRLKDSEDISGKEINTFSIIFLNVKKLKTKKCMVGKKMIHMMKLMM